MVDWCYGQWYIIYHHCDIFYWYIHLRWIFNDINHPASLGYPHDLGNLHITISGWWFKTWFLWLSIQLGIVTPTDEVIFFRGVQTTHQTIIMIYIYILNIHRILHRVKIIHMRWYTEHINTLIYTYNTCRIQQNTWAIPPMVVAVTLRRYVSCVGLLGCHPYPSKKLYTSLEVP